MNVSIDFSNSIRDLSRQALNSRVSKIAQQVLRKSLVRPIDYMRYAEFSAILNHLDLKPNTTVLDVGSPQWFSICLAKQYPETVFNYVNIIDSEIEPFQHISEALEIRNLVYLKEDVRNLSFASDTFDQVISISVIEHIYPAAGGDYAALREINRVLKPNGELHLTVPYKDKENVVYMNGDVYERQGDTHTFFAREYDASSFSQLVQESNFSVKSQRFIIERPGLLALDYYEWGPGKSLFLINYVAKLLRLIEKLSRYSLDGLLAQRYLQVVPEPGDRLVNIASLLTPADLS